MKLRLRINHTHTYTYIWLFLPYVHPNDVHNREISVYVKDIVVVCSPSIISYSNSYCLTTVVVPVDFGRLTKIRRS